MGDLDGLIRDNHDAIVKIATDVEWIKKKVDNIEKTLSEDVMKKIDELENFKNKLVGVAMGVSAIISLAVSLVMKLLH